MCFLILRILHTWTVINSHTFFQFGVLYPQLGQPGRPSVYSKTNHFPFSILRCLLFAATVGLVHIWPLLSSIIETFCRAHTSANEQQSLQELSSSIHDVHIEATSSTKEGDFLHEETSPELLPHLKEAIPTALPFGAAFVLPHVFCLKLCNNNNNNFHRLLGCFSLLKRQRIEQRKTGKPQPLTDN